MRVGDVVEPVLGEALATAASTRCSSLVIQRSAGLKSVASRAGTGRPGARQAAVLPSQFISTKRVAFHSLLQKLR
jgi:hypothetical protein